MELERVKNYKNIANKHNIKRCKHLLTMQELYEFCHKVLNHANQQPS